MRVSGLPLTLECSFSLRRDLRVRWKDGLGFRGSYLEGPRLQAFESANPDKPPEVFESPASAPQLLSLDELPGRIGVGLGTPSYDL